MSARKKESAFRLSFLISMFSLKGTVLVGRASDGSNPVHVEYLPH